MAMIIPSTTIAVMRLNAPAIPDDYAPEPAWQTVATGVPVWLSEKDQKTFDPVSGRTTIVEQWVLLLRTGSFRPTETDRIEDERTGTLYQVDQVQETTGLFARNIECRCSRVAG